MIPLRAARRALINFSLWSCDGQCRATGARVVDQTMPVGVDSILHECSSGGAVRLRVAWLGASGQVPFHRSDTTARLEMAHRAHDDSPVQPSPTDLRSPAVPPASSALDAWPRPR